MTTRRIAKHTQVTLDGDQLMVLTVYEEGYSKERIKRENNLSKTHDVLVKYGNRFEFVRKKA